jgi:3-deoxy-7-phosphoheptulonate synthase
MKNGRILNGEKHIIELGHLKIGDGQSPIFISGPCSVESREQVMETALALKGKGLDVLRGGVFKPRTSPYEFQGMGLEGLRYLKEAGEAAGVPVVTELMDETQLSEVLEYADIIQIGSRNMYNYSLLKVMGQVNKPVLLKRGMSATIKEWIMAAEYIAMSGNKNIILCERGIRSYDTYTRNTLDLAAVPIMQMETGLPVIVDPSHATGKRELIAPMSRAAIAAGADGLMVEVHIRPDEALCDGPQSLTPEAYPAMIDTIRIR